MARKCQSHGRIGGTRAVIPERDRGCTRYWRIGRPCSGILPAGGDMVEMRVRRTELLEAMKGCLHDLEELKLLTPDDLEIIDERRILRVKIAELEKELHGR
jgi:hypothetical protein